MEADGVSPNSDPRRDELLADVAARRERLNRWKRWARRTESTGGLAIALVAAVAFRVVWVGGVFVRSLSPWSWLFTIVVGLVALVVARGVIATIAARWLVPARRDLVTAESRLAAHDAVHDREL